MKRALIAVIQSSAERLMALPSLRMEAARLQNCDTFSLAD
jgi:hypothetical protein